MVTDTLANFTAYSFMIARHFPIERKIRFLNAGLLSEKLMKRNFELGFTKNLNNSGRLC